MIYCLDTQKGRKQQSRETSEASAKRTLTSFRQDHVKRLVGLGVERLEEPLLLERKELVQVLDFAALEEELHERVVSRRRPVATRNDLLERKWWPCRRATRILLLGTVTFCLSHSAFGFPSLAITGCRRGRSRAFHQIRETDILKQQLLSSNGTMAPTMR